VITRITADASPEALPRVLTDPRGLIIEIVARVEAHLAADDVAGALDEAVRNGRSGHRRLAQALDANPALLTSGRPDGPPLLDRFIRALLARGAQRVVIPRCGACGKPNPLRQRHWQSSLRICTPCHVKERAARNVCSSCGRSAPTRYLDRSGQPVCRGCSPQDDGSEAVRQICTQVRSIDPQAGLDAVREALEEVTGGRLHRARRLAWALEDEPGLLSGQGHLGPSKMIHLIEELRSRGVAVVPPRCPSCDRQVLLRFGLDGQRVCRACYGRARGQACSGCGLVREVSTRTPEGAPLCNNCGHQHPMNHETCIGCLRSRFVARRSPEGPLCTACHRAARRRSAPPTVCALCGQRQALFALSTGMPRCHSCSRRKAPCEVCGRTMPIWGRTPTGSLCRSCFDKHPVAFKTCSNCGAVERLYHFGLCARCACDRRLRQLLADPTGELRPELEPLHRALLAGDPVQVLSWLSKSAATDVLADIAAGRCALTHELLDERSSKAVNHLRALLVFAGVLPERDEHLAALERWCNHTIAHISDPGNQQLIRSFVTWHHLARLRRRLGGKPATYAQINRIRRNVIRAIEFLDWLAAQGLSLRTCRQLDADRWLSGGSTLRHEARDLVLWARRNGLTGDIEIPAYKERIHVPPVEPDRRAELVRRLLYDQTITLTDRVAGLLVVLYAQSLSAVSQLTIDQVSIGPRGVTLALSQTPLELPEPLGHLVQELLAQRRGHASVGRGQPSPWLFRGGIPGRHISPTYLAKRLRALLGIRALPGRTAALLDLSAQLPAAVLSRLLGISEDTASRWADEHPDLLYAAEVARRHD
jgi:hypothetical protein